MSIPLSEKPISESDLQQPETPKSMDERQPPPIEKPRTRWPKFALRLLCTILLLAFLFHSFSWSNVLQKLQHIDDGEVIVAVIVGIIGVVLSAYQWQSLLDGERIRMDLRRLINLYFIGISFNHFLPTGMGGDVVKAYYVGREAHNTVGSASAVIMSRVTGFAGMLLLTIPTLIIWHTLFSTWIMITFGIACLIMCSALVCVYFMAALLPGFIKGKWATYRSVKSVLAIGLTLRESLKHPKALCIAIAFGFLFHVSAALNYYGFATLLHMHIPLPFYLIAVPLVSLIAFLPTTINGYGLRENAFIGIFASMHVDIATATALILLMDAQGIFFGVVGGILYLLRHEKKTTEIPDNHTVSMQKQVA
ncbi:lysylphosphatidylglycerol synthase transmembrane domain-containing protein [Dictyobacter arantiisoli]|uniref:Dolichol-P-glucose synthetase n=1 Tax=Dictyobacter arantiisoli TaxID=2014874 RepID=A0A5A5T7D2_9CHLR|nr:lysylphosphatidylglycerol synthase transmembrane domain-containing protein [Dictyobacter arantiisoli]GCF07391.1 hypothetical protein KDI_09550 [Dictyobacter arantiisoli]